MTILIGIDPGNRGAIVEIDTYEKACRYMKIPYCEDGLLEVDLINAMFNFRCADFIYLEQVHSNKIWGIPNNFAFGGYYNQMRLMIKKHPNQLVTPKKWQAKAHVGQGSKDLTAKEKSLIAFKRLNPSFGKIQKGDDGIIDAFFIARFAGQDNSVTVPNDLLFIECV
jgi:hypothetical protein